MKNVTQQLADFVVETRYKDLPEGVVHEAKRVLLDSIGCAFAGIVLDKGKLSVKLARRLGGTPESSILGVEGKVSSTNAAFANGELINALDYDATLQPGTHVSPFVIPPAIALGESRSVTGKELILAVVMGHEITCRIASGLSGPSKFMRNGGEMGHLVRLPVHGYSANAFGSVASAGKVLKLNNSIMANAFGIAGYNSPMQASSQRNHSGTDCMMKWASPGWMAQMGTTAALLAETGYTGDAGVLNGEYSFWRFSGSEEWHPEETLRNLGQEWHILNTRYKHYPCCGLIIPPLELFTRIMEKNKLTPEEIQEVKIWMDPSGAMPLWRNKDIDNDIQAQFSVAYSFAIAAYGIPPGVEWQDPIRMKSPEVKEFMGKVNIAVHPNYEKPALKPPSGPMAIVIVVVKNNVYKEETSVIPNRQAQGDTVAKDNLLADKFKHNVSKALSNNAANDVIKSVWKLEDIDNISLLTEKITVRANT